MRTKHPAASGPKTRLGLRQAGHVLPCGPLGRCHFTAPVTWGRVQAGPGLRHLEGLRERVC